MNDDATLSMPRSLASELQDVRQIFPIELIDSEGWKRLLIRAATVPASLIENIFGFELRLGRSERAADLCVTVQAGSSRASEFLRFPQVDQDIRLIDGVVHSPHRLNIDSEWHAGNKTLCNLLSEIARIGSFANNAVRTRSIILEYDVVEPSRGRSSAPGVFWGLADHVMPEQMWEIVRMLDLASNQMVNPQQVEKQSEKDQRVAVLRNIAETTMTYGRITQVGSFLGRDKSGFRILVRIEDRQAIEEFLQAVGWSGNVAKLIEVVSSFDFEDIDFGIALDVSKDGVGQRIGLEVAARGGWFATRFANWQPLVNALVVNGLCRTDKARGLQRWCGYMDLFGREMFVLIKGISHFKISLRKNEPLEAKAYLGARRVLARDIGLK